MIEEALLVSLFKGGRLDAFDEIYNCYYKKVYSYINGLVKDQNSAEDLAQDTLLKVYGALKDVDESRRLSPWIFRIAHNTCLDYLRKRRPDYGLQEDMTCAAPESVCPENMVLNREIRDKLKEALDMMGMEYRRVLLLRAYSCMSYKDIASRLDLKESAVKTILHRGRKRLQRLYIQVYRQAGA